MLSVETTDNWSTAGVDVTVGAATETYSHSGHGSAYHLAEDFVAWANDAGRAWSGTALFTWTWTKGSNRGAELQFQVSGGASATWAPNVAWASLTNMTSATAATWSATDGATATACPSQGLTVPSGQGSGHWTVRRAYRFSGDSGDASATTATRPGVQGLFGVVPALGAIGDTLDAARLSDVFKQCSNPRRLAVYNVERTKWHEFAFADVTVEALAPKLFSIVIRAAGETL